MKIQSYIKIFVIAIVLLFLYFVFISYSNGPLIYISNLKNNKPSRISKIPKPNLSKLAKIEDILSSLDCPRILNGDVEYIKRVAGKNRIKYDDIKDPGDDYWFPMDCDSIYERNPFIDNKPVSEIETEFPVAFAKLVYRVIILKC